MRGDQVIAFPISDTTKVTKSCPVKIAGDSQERSSTSVNTQAIPVSLKFNLGCRTRLSQPPQENLGIACECLLKSGRDLAQNRG